MLEKRNFNTQVNRMAHIEYFAKTIFHLTLLKIEFLQRPRFNWGSNADMIA